MRERTAAVGYTRLGCHLCCEGLPLVDLARRFGTPLFIYSAALLDEAFHSYDRAFSGIPHLICYAAKANGASALLRRFAQLGAGIDAVSGFELRAALEASFPNTRVHFGGAGKTDAEIELALGAGVALIVDSEQELRRVNEQAARRGCLARVSLRLNLDIDTGAHPYHSVGKSTSKFGIDSAQVGRVGEFAKDLRHVQLRGLHAHIGSQIFDTAPYKQCASAFTQFVAELRGMGHPIDSVNLGGGLGIDYADGRRASPAALAKAVIPALAPLDVTILVEPGRSLVGQSGILVTQVIYRKVSYDRLFLIVDAAMNDFIRPALYQSTHRIEPVLEAQRQTDRADVVGPVCEEGDFFARDYPIQQVEVGEYVAIRDVGAYGFCMSSNYNLRPRAAEVLVCDGVPELVRRRETYEDIVRMEQLTSPATQ
jgi:diaminopimelate decarboxylase